MISMKFLDALARMPGNDGQDADAMSAYTQSVLEGPPTWISLPRDRWPKGWRNMKRPVVPLRLSLYGHPLAGLYWEKHCQRALLSCGFRPVKGWECLYAHTQMRLFLSIYVDDLKMAGAAASIPKMWKMLSEKIQLEPPTPLEEGTYLGCEQRPIQMPESMLSQKKEVWRRLFADRKEGFSDDELTSSSDASEFNCTTSESETSDSSYSTPKGGSRSKNKQKNTKHKVLPATSTPQGGPNQKKANTKRLERNSAAKRVKAYEYDMSGHAQQCVERYSELADIKASSLKNLTGF